ncbi:MAG: Flp pilus assembly complex ATPase component TadA [Phycisphaeraceae bacterium]|nr:Flp pilus assembly complex ATPase component TadA [Phycisphaeraceae bacterium]
MGKYNIDDILDRLGVDAEQPVSRRPKGEEPKRPHRIDQAESAFSPLPSAPAHQRRGEADEPAGSKREAEEAGAGASPPAKSAARNVYRPKGELQKRETRGLAETLVSRSIVTAERMTAAQTIVAQTPGQDLAGVLVEQGADEVEVQRVVAELASVPFERVDLEKGLDGGFDGKLLQRLTAEFCRKHGVLPLRMEGRRVVVGATRPDDVFLLDEIRRRLEVPSVKLVLIAGYDVRGALEIVGDPGGSGAEDGVDLNEILTDVDEADVELERMSNEEVDLEAKAGESPVIRYVNYIIQTAIKEGASDIHVEPAEKKLKVRFRIDGELYEMLNPPVSMSAAITSRLKIMANLDISERRIPQDGRIKCTVQGRKLDLRVSTLPTAFGEKTVMRILDTRSINVQLEDLGFSEQTMELWRQQINSPHGIVLVTGPTGSGKTTTLYSSLRQLDKTHMNISTVEDPVEYSLDGITQTQVHEKIGMGFATALRALLRQDPDVIMLGEIRDQETALIAVQAALTGHLVLSTLHTNDAPSSITRLVNIGIEPFLIGAAINGVLAQRLVRRLCKHCKIQAPAPDDLREFLEIQGHSADEIWTPRGCDRCRNTGYAGRVGIYELLVVDDQVRDVIARNPNVAEFRRQCLERGMISLRDDGMQKVAQGMTSFQEVLRATKEAM